MRSERRAAETRETVKTSGLHAVSPRGRESKPKWRKAILVTGLAIISALFVAMIILGREWPFTRAHTLDELGQASRTTVSAKIFHQIFFPHPGCVLEDVTFRNSAEPKQAALATVGRLVIQGSYSGLLSKHVPLIRAERAHVVLPPLSSNQRIFGGQSSKTHAHIDEIVADGAILDISSRMPGNTPLRFEIRKLTVHDPGAEHMSFEVDVLNPKPPGEIFAKINLGRWQAQNPALTQVSGTYSFRHAQLNVISGIGGVLSSEGSLQGPINKLEIHGSTDIPDFEVKRSGHKIHLTTHFDALVDGTRGNVVLRSLNAHWGHTTVTGTGTIGGTAGTQGKSAALDLAVRDGRIEDVLFLFVRAPRAPLVGETNLQTKITIPPGQRKFVEKVELNGNFVIHSARFTSATTQARVDRLSAQAQGEKNVQEPTTVSTEWQGRVLLKDGVAHFSSLRIHLPGAGSRLHGTYGLENQRINLHGMLFLQAKLSQTMSGIKSILIKPIESFLKKDRRGGAKMPVGITGTYHSPSFHKDPI